MPAHTERTDATIRETPPAPLQVLAEILARLAAAPALGEELPSILETLRRAVHATECGLWMNGPHGLVRGGVARATGAPHGTSNRSVTPRARMATTEVAAVLAGEGTAERVAVRMLCGDREVGVLAIMPERALTADEQTLVTGVANLLGPALVQAEYSHRLEVEVALRTRQMEEQHRFIEKIVDSLPVGLYVIDREYRIRAWNRKRETGMQGVSREEALGRTIFEILHRQPAAVLRQEFEEVFSTGRMQQFQMESRASGEQRIYRISKIPMRLDDGPVTHIITIGEDMTEWREAMDRIAQAEKLAAIGTLAAGVMHEINNPLATIAACAESLQLRVEDAVAAGETPPFDAGDYLRLIDNEVHRCKRIIDGLLDFSRPKGAARELVDVNDVIDRTLFLLKHHARFKKLRVELALDRAISARAHANPEQLIQVFMALLINAMDAMGEMGTIAIRTRAGSGPRDAIVAEVVDTGHGIPRGEVPKIFEPFYTTKPPGRGTGLGLSICYGIIADHGGRIEVDSAPGHGSTFRVVLPDGAA